MNINITNLPKSKVKIDINLSDDEFSLYLTEATEELSKTIEISGFRPGKAPQKIVEEKIGKDKVLEEAVNIALNKTFPKIVEEKKLRVLGQPQAKVDFPKLKNTGNFSAEIEAALFPEINLPDWKKIAKDEELKEIKVEKKEVSDSLFWLQKSRAKYTRKLSGAEKGDQVEIDYEIRSGGVKIENGEIKNQKIILGEEKLLPDFEKNLIGMKEMDEKIFSLKCPENFWKKELKGKVLDFKVKIKSIFKVEVPEANDDFARSLGNFKDLDELKENILKGIEIEKTEIEKRRWQSVVIEKIASRAEIEIPEVLIEEQRNQMIDDLRKTVEEQMGVSLEEHLSRLKKTLEDLKNDFWKEAEKRLRITFCIYDIAQKENIYVEEEEIDKEIEQAIQRYPQIIEEIKKTQEKNKFRDFIREKILEKKVFNLLDESRDK